MLDCADKFCNVLSIIELEKERTYRHTSAVVFSSYRLCQNKTACSCAGEWSPHKPVGVEHFFLTSAVCTSRVLAGHPALRQRRGMSGTATTVLLEQVCPDTDRAHVGNGMFLVAAHRRRMHVRGKRV